MRRKHAGPGAAWPRQNKCIQPGGVAGGRQLGTYRGPIIQPPPRQAGAAPLRSARRCRKHGRVGGSASLVEPHLRLLGAPNLLLQLQHAVQQRLRGGWAAGDVDVDGHDTVAAAHHRVRVCSPGRGAGRGE